MPTAGSAELRIPFSQLRFNDRSPQVWGLNIERRVPARNEEVFWALVPRTERRWASLFGDLHGIDGIRAAAPASSCCRTWPAPSQVIGDRDRANPFTSAANLDGRAGLDVKMGLGSNLTLEATVNPDFGQVEADPAEVNLSAFETFFDGAAAVLPRGRRPADGLPSTTSSTRAGSARRRQAAPTATTSISREPRRSSARPS